MEHTTVGNGERTGTHDADYKPRFSSIGIRIYGLAALLIVLAASSLLFVGYTASAVADRQALAHETQMFRNALSDHHMLMARDQLSLARWDRSVENIVTDLDKDFVRDEFIDSHWYDFGLERAYLISPQDTIIAQAERDDVIFPRRKINTGNPLWLLADRARERYMAVRVPRDGGYGVKAATASQVDQIAELAFAEIDGIPMALTAMAIAPDSDETTLPDGPPVVLISSRHVDAEFVADLATPLSLSEVRFLEKALPGPGSGVHELRGINGHILGSFAWRAISPGKEVWALVVPIVIALAGLLAFAAYMASMKIARLSASLEESERINHHHARHDALTGLKNRLAFSESLQEALNRLPGQPFALIGCDLDRFKAVNDTYGHGAGDTVIRTVAERLRAAVGDTGVIGRIGGDEFVLLITKDADRSSLNALSARILTSVAKPVQIAHGITTDVGISLGIAIAPDCGKHEVELVSAADKALYAAKENGRNQAIHADVTQASASTENTNAA
ncbi:diguanylate cyclase domain-containing protein [Roseibium sp.]|uniref:diguanylate cyclase domain-containing protein n=1 Tax=Roseibium sp. TaxID=1936156 RepID=UPI003A984886